MLCLLGFALPAKHSAFLVLRLVLFQKMFVQFNICVLTSCLTRSYTLLQTEGTFSDYVHIDCVGGNSTSPIIRLYRDTPCCVIVGSVRFHISKSGILIVSPSTPPNGDRPYNIWYTYADTWWTGICISYGIFQYLRHKKRRARLGKWLFRCAYMRPYTLLARPYILF